MGNFRDDLKLKITVWFFSYLVEESMVESPQGPTSDKYAGFPPLPWQGNLATSVYLCVMYSCLLSFSIFFFLIHDSLQLAHWIIVHIFTLAVPGLSFVVPFELFRKYPSFLFVRVLELCIYFSVTSWSHLGWWHGLRALFSYLTKQVFVYFSWILIFSHSAHLLLSPPPPPPPFHHDFLHFCLWLLQLFAWWWWVDA